MRYRLVTVIAEIPCGKGVLREMVTIMRWCVCVCVRAHRDRDCDEFRVNFVTILDWAKQMRIAYQTMRVQAVEYCCR